MNIVGLSISQCLPCPLAIWAFGWQILLNLVKSIGSVFQRIDAATEKAPVSMFVSTLGTQGRSELDDQSTVCVPPGIAVSMKAVREPTALRGISELMRRLTKVQLWPLWMCIQNLEIGIVSSKMHCKCIQ